MSKKQVVKFTEFMSVIGFGLAYWRYDLQIATLVLMALMTLFIVLAKVLREPLTKLQWGTWLVVVVLGTATVLVQDELFIKWKTTVINLALAAALGLSHVLGDKTLAERLVGDKIQAPQQMLRNLNGAAVFYFLLVAGLNLVFAYRFTTTEWVQFKLFGLFALNVLFISGGIYYLRDYLRDLSKK